MSSKSGRFVVLRHTPGNAFSRTPNIHLDWMFERGGVLQTWASEVCDFMPSSLLGHPIELLVIKLDDHRIDYLDYEGKISGERGDVQRVAGGFFQAFQDDANKKIFHLDVGSRSDLIVELNAKSNDGWTMMLQAKT